MTETVRFVADGEELVLSATEAFRVRSTPEPRPESAAPKRLAIQYLGFKDSEGRREYALNAQHGDEVRRYTVWIALAAFAERRVLLQDGPDICYQKLMRLLKEAEPIVLDSIAVTDGELAAYRETHTAPTRRGFSSPAPVAKAAETPTDDQVEGT